MNTRISLKKKIIKEFKKGKTTNDLIKKYNLPKSTINDWLRNVRLKIEDDTIRTLSNKYSKLHSEYEKVSLELEIYQKLNCLPSMDRITKLNAIEEHQDIFPLKTMCRILNVDSSTALNHIKRRVKTTTYEINDEMLKPLILDIFNKSKQRFGSTKIAPVLKREGYTASIAKVKTLMNELGIKPVNARRKSLYLLKTKISF